MSKLFIKPLTTNSVHKLLYTRQAAQKQATELTEAYDKHRDEIRKIYKQKCEYFLAGVRQYHNDNYEILIHQKTDTKSRQDDLVCMCNRDINCGEPRMEEETCIGITNGGVFRRKTKRYFTESPVISQKVCGIEPWLKRFLVLNRFIEAARKIIVRNRLMKRLARLKLISADPTLLRKDSFIPFRKEYLNYGKLTYKLDKL